MSPIYKRYFITVTISRLVAEIGDIAHPVNSVAYTMNRTLELGRPYTV